MDRIANKIRLGIAMAIVCLTSALGATDGTVSIVPLPVSIEERSGEFVIDSSTHVIAEGQAAIEASKLIEALAPAMGFRLKLGRRVLNSIQLDIDSSLKGFNIHIERFFRNKHFYCI